MLTVTYPALFYYDDTQGEDVAPFTIFFPDFNNGATQGSDINDAMYMASDWLGLTVGSDIDEGRKLPEPTNINLLDLEKDNPFKDEQDFQFIYDKEKSFISLVTVDLKEYIGLDEPVKKTLTIPLWADKLGKEKGINFSQTLTEAILEKSSIV